MSFGKSRIRNARHRVDNLNNSVKNSLKNLKIFFKNNVHFQFGFYVYLILFKVVMKLLSIYF